MTLLLLSFIKVPPHSTPQARDLSPIMVLWLRIICLSIRHTQTYSAFKPQLKTHYFVLPNLPTEPQFSCIWLSWCSLHLICSLEMCPWSMYSCIACFDRINCSGMCTCLPALCCWRWIVWCMPISCFDCDVHSRFELWSALSQSSWIRRYTNVTYYYYCCCHTIICKW